MPPMMAVDVRVLDGPTFGYSGNLHLCKSTKMLSLDSVE